MKTKHIMIASLALLLGFAACIDHVESRTSALETDGPADPIKYDDHCALPGEVPKGGFFQDEAKCNERSQQIKDGKATCETGGNAGTRCQFNKNTGPDDKGVCVCYIDSVALDSTPRAVVE